jgi:RNA polymerase sigma-70 factor, ECF subfamily
MKENDDNILKNALAGDINAFQLLFAKFQSQLKSYLYRLTANRNDAEDLTHDTFIKAYDKLSSFKGDSSLKTWVFAIGTHLAYNYLQKRNRWVPDVKSKAKELVLSNPKIYESIVKVTQTSSEAVFDMKEHIDTCFTCMSKNLPIENQVALVLKDIYDFSVQEIGWILDKSEGVVKYLLQDGRKTMIDIFENRCALINKNGICNQCSELNGWFNPKQNQQEALIKLDLVKGSKKYDREQLYNLRTTLVKAIDPLTSKGTDLQEVLLKCNRMVMGEESIP